MAKFKVGDIVRIKDDIQKKKFLEYCDEFMEENKMEKFSNMQTWSDRKKAINKLIDKIN